MGMFDYIHVKMPLPTDPESPGNVVYFQTKDTPSQSLDKYTIETDGSLIEHAVRFEERSNSVTIAIPEPEKDRALPFHGDLRFHHYEVKADEWWEYTARFTDGKCTSMWCSQHTKRD